MNEGRGNPWVERHGTEEERAAFRHFERVSRTYGQAEAFIAGIRWQEWRAALLEGRHPGGDEGSAR